MKKLNLKDFKQTKDGRWINKTTGYFVRKPVSTELNKLNEKDNHVRHHASKRMIIRKYNNVAKDTDYFDIDFGGFGDGDLLYIAEMLRHIATKDACNESKDRPDFLK